MSVHALVNQIDKELGYESTYKGKDIGEEPVDDGIRVQKIVSKRPSQLKRSISRSKTRRDGSA